MKTQKNKSISFFKIVILLFGISILLWRCETQEIGFIEETENINNTLNEKISIISFNELPENVLDKISDINPNLNYLRNNNFDNLKLNQEQIIKIVDSLETTSYSLQFTLKNNSENNLYNLIVVTNKENNVQEPFILKYTIENLEEIKIEDGIIDFSKMKGLIQKYNFQNFIKDIKFGFHGRNSDNSCNTWDYGGESSAGDGDGSGGGSANVYTECNILIWSSGGSVFAISISCTEYSLRGGSNECGGSEKNYGGGIGINNGGNSNFCRNGRVVNGECVEDDENILEAPEAPIEDMQKFLKCFNSTQSAKLTIYVDQPIANQNDSWTSGNGKAGHAFISITQGSLTRSWGLYPAGQANPFNTNDPHVFGNNSQDEFDVSISKTINSTSLRNILDNARNYNRNYDLNSNNCTDYVISVGNLAGINLPDPQSTWPGGSGSNPGAFGQALRIMPLTNGMTRNTVTGISTQQASPYNCN